MFVLPEAHSKILVTEPVTVEHTYRGFDYTLTHYWIQLPSHQAMIWVSEIFFHTVKIIEDTWSGWNCCNEELTVNAIEHIIHRNENIYLDQKYGNIEHGFGSIARGSLW